MKNAISWFEIPVTDINRAAQFYETIFGIKLNALDMPNIKMRLFPIDDPLGVGGALADSGGFHKPSGTEGPLIYLNGNPDLSVALGKVEKAGGKVVMPKTLITDEIGYMAFFMDTEGNKVALHSGK